MKNNIKYRIIQINKNKFKIQKLTPVGFLFNKTLWKDLGNNYFRCFLIKYYNSLEEAKEKIESLKFKEKIVYEDN